MRRYTLGSVINLITLLLGLLAGFVLGTGYAEKNRVLAQAPKVEEVAPIMTVGSAGVGTLLAGRIAADSVSIQGIDILKLHENTLNFLREKFPLTTTAELQGVIERSRAETILRMKVPKPPATSPEKTPEKKGEPK